MSKLEFPVFDKVLTIGPCKKHGKGGISSVLATYSENFAPFHYLPTNSQRGTIPGLFRVAGTIIRMPLERLKGRKIAHFHYAVGKSWIRKSFLMSWARILGFKVVAHCHAAEMKLFTAKKGIPKIKKVLDKASANIVLSKSWESFFSNVIKCGNIHIVNNIVVPPLNTEINTKHSSVCFLFMGAIGDRKGIFDALEAVSNLKKQGLKLKLVVGGNGEIDRFHNEVKRLDIQDIIDFRGWISDADKKNAIADCDVLILPSHNEGLPISILEAMSYGKAVLSSPVGGIPEIITNGVNGFLVTPGNVDEIETAMKTYIENPSLTEKHGEASLPIIEKFYPQVVGAQLAEIYSAILEKYDLYVRR